MNRVRPFKLHHKRKAAKLKESALNQLRSSPVADSDILETCKAALNVDTEAVLEHFLRSNLPSNEKMVALNEFESRRFQQEFEKVSALYAAFKNSPPQ